MTTRDICEETLRSRIGEIDTLLNMASQCINHGYIFQSAVCLQEINKYIVFDELLLRIFDIESGSENNHG